MSNVSEESISEPLMVEKRIKKMLKDPLSIGFAHPLIILRDETYLATGTAFFYLNNEKLFLITAGHNITGRNPENNQLLGIPTKIAIMLYKLKDGFLAGWNTYKKDLYDESSEPLWLQHPTHGTNIDVVAIPWDIADEQGFIQPVNKINFDKELPIQVGMDLFVLGYPLGYICSPEIAPIWKRGTLATEFIFNIDNLPKIYIDTATAKGMSGSPVIAQLSGYYPEGKEKNFGSYVFSRGRRFIGIYTGRRTDEQTADSKSDIFNAQLGIVWKNEVIQEIVEQLK